MRDAPEAIPRRRFLDAGFTDRDVAQAVARGDLHRLSRGLYLSGADLPDAADATRVAYLARCLAEARGEVLSHQSAAVVHGLPLLKPDLRRVHVISGHRDGGRVRPRRHVHAAPYDADVVEIGGTAVTSPARTAVDVAKASSFPAALTVCDATLALGADRDEMAAMIERRPDRGVRTARRALAHADPRAESPGESWSRAQMIDDALPRPDLQVRFDLGDRLAFGDFGWDRRLVGEFDGRIKYQALLRPGETAAEAVHREKRREDALRAQGVMVVRWVWADLESGTMPALLRPWLARLGLL